MTRSKQSSARPTSSRRPTAHSCCSSERPLWTVRTEEVDMSRNRRWTVEVYVGDDGGQTYAEAALRDDTGPHVLGTGRAKANPTDPDVPEIGDEIAVARA